jgi:ankyrin repeat protein
MHQDTALFVAVCISLPLVVWLLDEKGADVNGTVASGITPLHAAISPDIITALLDRGADPTLQHISIGSVPLLMQSYFGIVNNMARLLQDPRVRANVNSQAHSGLTALHCACLSNSHETSVTSIILLLLQAGCNPNLANNAGEMPLHILRTRHPSYRDAIALLEQFPDTEKDAEKASLLVKARRLTIAPASNTVVPSCLRARVAGCQPLAHVELVRVTGGNKRAP